MRRNFIALFMGLVLTLLVVPLSAQVEAAILKFEPTASTASVNGTFDVNVNVDARNDQIAGTDIQILYDPTLIEPTAVIEGTYFPVVTNTITSGKVTIAAVIDSTGSYKTASGTVATITFKGLKLGTGTIRFDCDLTRSDSSKIIKNDINATNVIECSALNTNSVTIANLGGGVDSDGDGIPDNQQSVNGTGNGSGTSTGGNSQLLQSGIYENVLMLSIPGLSLLAFGLMLKLFLKV